MGSTGSLTLDHPANFTGTISGFTGDGTLSGSDQIDVGTLQPVVHRLGDGEEFVAAVHHLPVGVDADAAQQGDVGGEELGDAAAVRGGVDVQHPRTLEWFRQFADLVDDLRADHPRVVVEVLLEQGDAVEHGHSGVPGTGISVRVNQTLDSESTPEGATFTGVVTLPQSCRRPAILSS